MTKTLIIGFGNVYRRDDGVAFCVLNDIRKKLGRPLLKIDDDGFDDLGHEIDTLLLHQLVPELTEYVHPYDLLVFVDAHVGVIPESIHEETLAAIYKSTTVSHQLHPSTVLALTQELYDHTPRGVLLSIRGYDFDFGEELSEQTAAQVPHAAERILALAKE